MEEISRDFGVDNSPSPRFYRVGGHQVLADAQKCLLTQGLLCLGPATRSGCEARCIQGNMPCTGCFGPTSRVRDFSAKALCATASVAAGKERSQTEFGYALLYRLLGVVSRRLQATRMRLVDRYAPTAALARQG